MKSSNYNCCYPFEEGKMLLYNTRTNALAILDNSHFTSYEKFLRTGIIEDKNFEKNSTCAVAIWLGAAIKQQKYNSHILPSAL